MPDLLHSHQDQNYPHGYLPDVVLDFQWQPNSFLIAHLAYHRVPRTAKPLRGALSVPIGASDAEWESKPVAGSNLSRQGIEMGHIYIGDMTDTAMRDRWSADWGYWFETGNLTLRLTCWLG